MDPRYQPVSRRIRLDQYLWPMYHKCKADLMRELKMASYHAIATDGCQSLTTESYNTFTVDFLNRESSQPENFVKNLFFVTHKRRHGWESASSEQRRKLQTDAETAKTTVSKTTTTKGRKSKTAEKLKHQGRLNAKSRGKNVMTFQDLFNKTPTNASTQDPFMIHQKSTWHRNCGTALPMKRSMASKSIFNVSRERERERENSAISIHFLK